LVSYVLNKNARGGTVTGLVNSDDTFNSAKIGHVAICREEWELTNDTSIVVYLFRAYAVHNRHEGNTVHEVRLVCWWSRKDNGNAKEREEEERGTHRRENGGNEDAGEGNETEKRCRFYMSAEIKVVRKRKAKTRMGPSVPRKESG
jgi:hypothetical protein